MSNPPLVSIVTPSFNQGRFLRRTIESVLKQTYPHIEYFVIDGGSTDDSVDILASYGERVQWISEADAGQADAINKGFARCRGTLRAYLNSDDVLWPGAVETAVDYFAAHPDWDLLYGRAHYIDVVDRFLDVYATAPFSLKRLAEDSCICQPATFWRTQLAERVGPFNARLNYCMDYEYWLRAARIGASLVHVDDLLANSRHYPETKTVSGRVNMYLESIRICRDLLGRVPRGQYVGLWQYRCREHWTGWAGRFGRLPGVPGLLARLHHTWSNLLHPTAPQVDGCSAAIYNAEGA